jgi:hypothetical protein
MDVVLGLAILVALLVGAWFLAKWAWRAVTFPFRAVAGSRAPRGLGSEYERMVRVNGGTARQAAAASHARVVSSSPVTSDHYERIVTRETGFDAPAAPAQATSDLVIIPPPRRSRAWTREPTTELQEQEARADLAEPMQAPVVLDEPQAAAVAEPTPSQAPVSGTRPARWWRRSLRIPPWISLPLLGEGAYFVVLYPFGIDWYQYGSSLVVAVAVGVWAKRRYRVSVLHRHERGVVLWLRWGKPEADPSQPVIVPADSLVPTDTPAEI